MPVNIKAIILIVCLTCFFHSCSNDDHLIQILNRYETALMDLQNDYPLPSLAVAIVFDEKVIYANGC
jgi:hypothetical protein